MPSSPWSKTAGSVRTLSGDEQQEGRADQAGVVQGAVVAFPLLFPEDPARIRQYVKTLTRDLAT
ncbi:hypothetical protein ABZ297_39545 [Nonomuraea sp. NPDC005983]|uniref:hypothetical protein n=1 Tax=Nonomuraea sp. NPDC005983 TaxID=3155595 RepID=UPI0033BBAEEC